MVMDFAQGGDFFSFLRRHRRLPEAWARFYLGELSLALQHLHDIAVVYRDLKPENVLLDGRGHAMLADFGLSRNFARRPAGRDKDDRQTPPPPPDQLDAWKRPLQTRSYCGTEQYMAPEMLLQRAHTRAAAR